MPEWIGVVGLMVGNYEWTVNINNENKDEL